MRSGLYIAPTAPTTTLSDGTVVPDPAYYIIRTLNAALPTYGGQLLIHSAPDVPIPGDASLVLHDGTTDWHWGDLIAERPLMYRFLMHALWTRTDGTRAYGTIREMNTDPLFLATLTTNMPAHEFFGDGT